MGEVNTFCKWVTLFAIPYQSHSFIKLFAGIVLKLLTFHVSQCIELYINFFALKVQDMKLNYLLTPWNRVLLEKLTSKSRHETER